MKNIDETTYLIERRGELEEAVLHYFQGHLPSDYCIYYDDVPGIYPYVVVMLDDDEREKMSFTYVPIGVFERNEDTDQTNLYEFKLRRTYLTSPYNVVESTYQLPAKDIFKAMVELGQIFHRDEEYNLEVISWVFVI